MKYISLGSKKEKYSLKEVVFKGLAPDGSLFMPEHIPALPSSFLDVFQSMDLPEMAFHILKPYVSADINDDILRTITRETFSFNIPVRQVEADKWVLELYHGPTQAFKDVGARFLSRLLGHFNQGSQQKLMVLTATSGDTGGAVANGFHNVPGIEVVILYPYKKVSPYQEYQMTSPGGNVHAIAVDGSFDDCQRLVKMAFNDSDLRQKLYMTSANSINMGRLLPQMVYYFQAVAGLRQMGHFESLVISVPSGNFGNITAAMLAHKMGLPVKRFIAATNANDVVPRFLVSGKYDPQKTIPTIANAMDVGDPSNFCRLFDLLGNDLDTLRSNMTSYPVTDDEIKQTIVATYKDSKYVMDPHTASAFFALKNHLAQDETGLFVSTAHPYKFNEVMEPLIPEGLKNAGYSIDYEAPEAEDVSVMAAVYEEFKNQLEKLA
jgi:threonine synthase